MNNDSTRKPGPGRHGLWSRLTSALRQLAVTRGTEQNYPDTMAGQTGHAGVAAGEVRNTLTNRFASQLFGCSTHNTAHVLLPQHRRAFTSAWLASDWQTLADCSHQLAGAVAYCDLPELAEALGDLESAIRDANELRLQQTYNRASREIDDLLAKSGLRGS